MTGEVIMGEEVRPLVSTSYRKPQQHRSRETVEKILAAADAEIGEVGLHAASTTTIAKRAGLSVGALYRFFKDKDEIADALTAEYLSDVWASHQDLARGHAADDLTRTVSDWIAQTAREQVRHPGFFRLAEAPPDSAGAAAEVREQLVTVFAGALRQHGVVGEDDELLRAVELCAETVRNALVRSPDDAARTRVIGELDVMIPTYLAARFPQRT